MTIDPGDLIACAFVASWLTLVGVGLWRDLPTWLSDVDDDGGPHG